MVGEKSKVVARWHRVPDSDRLQPEIVTVSDTELQEWKGDSKRKIIPKNATVVDSRVVDPFDLNPAPSVEALRGPDGLRRWTNDDVVPRPNDVFQERLYCIRWMKTVMEINAAGLSVTKTVRRYAAPDTSDLAREAKVLELLRERFADWQREGFIPSKAIPEGGAKTEEPIRTRGWTHWHHLFTPKQLLVIGLLAEQAASLSNSKEKAAANLLGVGRLSNWSSRLCRWHTGLAHDKGEDVFSNQALNTLFSYCCRPLEPLRVSWPIIDKYSPRLVETGLASVTDARDLRETCDLWVTDPPYADAINYHELGDFFLAWYDKQLVDAKDIQN